MRAVSTQLSEIGRKCVAWLCCLGLLLSYAPNASAIPNNPQGKIKHVIIVIQENRTPDNLFFADNILAVNGGNVRPPGNTPQGPCKLNGQTNNIALSAWKLDACFDPRHRHLDWMAMYDPPPPPSNGAGGLDGACNIVLNTTGCPSLDLNHIPACPDSRFRWCPEYTYVSQPIGLATYFDIAHKYGFANYMFQTNQGPSFPAHQFLFGATSLPFPFSQDQTKSKWFAADNPIHGGSNPKFGCVAPSSEVVSLVDANGWPDCDANPDPNKCIYPCLDHNTMVNVMNSTTPVRWRYYAHSEQDLWEAPAAVLNVCVPNNPPPNGTSCTGTDYNNSVVYPSDNDKARILTDLADCSRIFPKLSWVIPDGKWSDHAGTEGRDGGPSWVGHIINAVGNSTCTGDDHANWSNTVILVTWDDWGGWYDHVNPRQDLGGPGIGYNTQPTRDSSWYVYGFRVPLLVISAFNKHVTNGLQGYTGYISGTTPTPVCPGVTCHDFGSLLNFVEFTFGTGDSYLGTIGDGHSSYADRLAPDAFPTCPDQAVCPYSLSDFFNFDHAPTTFVPITGFKYPETCFHQPDQAGCWPGSHAEDPDNDALED